MPTISVSEKEMAAILWFREKARHNLKTFKCEDMFKLHDASLNRMRKKYSSRKKYEFDIQVHRRELRANNQESK